MLATLGFTAIYGCARRLPLGTGYALARAGARLHARLAPRRRATLAANLEVAQRFSGGAALELETLVERAFDQHARALVDWLRASAGHRSELELAGAPLLDRALSAGRGAILGTLHIG
ncbi:MAG TPA: hypothetical protein VNM87_07450, partial [Candidatus Udaeobacter sp.]|nr:hypothetical protein [Candidatus Udaeobacter sp.]